MSQSQGGSKHQDDKLKVDCQSIEKDAQKDNQNIIIQKVMQKVHNNLEVNQQDANLVQLNQQQQINNDASEDKQNNNLLINQENLHESINQQSQEISNHFDVSINIQYKGILLTQDEKKIILWTDFGLLTIWSQQKGEIINQYQININNVKEIEIFQINKLIIIGDNKIVILNLQNGKQRMKIQKNMNNLVQQFDLNSFNEYYLVCGKQNKFMVYRLENLKKVRSFINNNNHKISIKKLKIMKQSTLIYMFDDNQKIIFCWNFIQRNGWFKIIYKNNEMINCMLYYNYDQALFSDDLQNLFIHYSMTIVNIDIIKKNMIFHIRPFNFQFKAISISNKYVAVSTEGALYIESLENLKNLQNLQNPAPFKLIQNQSFDSILFSKLDHKKLFLYKQGQIKIWNTQDPFQDIRYKQIIISQIEYSNDGLSLLLKIQNKLLFCNLETGLIYDSIEHDFDIFYICKSGQFIIFLKQDQQDLQYFDIISKQWQFNLTVNLYDKNNPQKILKLIQSQKENLICVIKKFVLTNLLKATIFILDRKLKNTLNSYELDANNGVFSNDCRFLVYSCFNCQCDQKCKKACCDNYLRILQINQNLEGNQTQFLQMKKIKLITENFSKQYFDFIMTQYDSLIVIFGTKIRVWNLQFKFQEIMELGYQNITVFNWTPGKQDFHTVGENRELYLLNKYQILNRYMTNEGFQNEILDLRKETNPHFPKVIRTDKFIFKSILSSNGMQYVLLKEQNILEVWNKVHSHDKKRYLQLYISKYNIKLYDQIFGDQSE